MPEIRLLHTTPFRIALLYVGLMLASVLVVLALVYWFTVGFIARQTDDTIAAEIAGLNEQYRQRGMPGLVEVVADRSAVPRTESVYLVTDPTLNPLAGNLSRWPVTPVRSGGWISFEIEGTDQNGEGQSHTARAITFTLPGQYHLLVGRDMRERDRFQQRVTMALAWALLPTVGLGILGGVLMSRNMMRRVEGINRTADRIMTGDLHERVPVSGSGDELDQLAGNLNAMLDQIEQLMTGMRQVTESIAHDLRTPLTRLRSRLEISLLEDNSADAYRAAVQEAIGEADRLLSTFAALLSIAEAEAGTRQENFKSVQLTELARRMADLYEPVAEETGIAFITEVPDAASAPGPTVLGNEQLLAQAVANLLDNALKYTPAGGRITLTVSPGDFGAGPALTVADTGPGIPADQRDKVLQRFFRLEWSRSTPGNGLGLSLVDAVARRHGARLVLDDNSPGLRISIVFPQRRPLQGVAARPLAAEPQPVG